VTKRCGSFSHICDKAVVGFGMIPIFRLRIIVLRWARLYLYGLERVAHHGDEHVDEDDDDDDVVYGEQQQPHALHNVRAALLARGPRSLARTED